MSSLNYLSWSAHEPNTNLTMTLISAWDGSPPLPETGKRYNIISPDLVVRDAFIESWTVWSDINQIQLVVSSDPDNFINERNEVDRMRWYDTSDDSVTLTTTSTSSAAYDWDPSASHTYTINYDYNIPTYKWATKDEVKDMKNLLRKVYVVRREEGGYAFAEFGPYVSKDPEKLVQHVLLKFGSKDAIFANVDLESGDDKLTFVVQTLSDTVIPELDD